MFIEERHQAILNIINNNGRITIGEIQGKFNISVDSARRDLRILEEKGLLKRTHGGAIPITQVGILPPRHRDMKNMDNHVNYAAIAKKAAEFIKENDIVYLTNGSFGFIMLKYLPKDIKYTLVVNSASLANELKYWDNITVYLYLKETFNKVDFITIENVERGKSPFITNPEIISRVVKEANIKFLLDISHAKWASNNRNEDFITYLNRLPLDKIYEVHINGWAEKAGDIMCHIKIGDEGYEILQYLLSKCSPEIITLEYGRHNDRIGLGCPIMKPDCINNEAKDEIIEQVNKLRKLIHKC